MRRLKIAGGIALLLGTSACDLLGGKKAADAKVATKTKASTPESRLCASNATYAKLKQSAFDDAKRIRERDGPVLDSLAEASIVRMENPLVESTDAALGLTVCSGRMILELPPGSRFAFDGKQRLTADVTYSAQTAADGSGTVYKIDGGEPIIYRLASFEARGTRTAAVQPDGFDVPTPEVAPEPVTQVDEPVVNDPRPVLVNPEPPASRRVADTDIAAELAAEREQARADARTRDRAETRRLAERARLNREAAAERTVRAERAAEAERRAQRVAAARRDDRGERDLAAQPSRVARPSFNCRYARSRVEKTICGSDDLASRDRGMANLYFRTIQASDPVIRRRLSASRLRFLSYRDRCGSEACIAAAYDDRVDEINDIAGE